MIVNVKFFNTERELSSLTQLNHDQLWDNGFDLDDWDWGFQIPSKYVDLFKKKEWQVISAMDNYCCGTQEVTYQDMTYIMLYHS